MINMNMKNNESPCSKSQSPPNSDPLCDSSNPSHKRKAGRKKFRETRHPVYRGVRQRNGNRWVCEIREPVKKSRIWVGTYPSPEMAARAHDVAVLALNGISAKFNFPDSVSLLPLAKSSSAADIREAAKTATVDDTFTPNTSFSCSSHGNSSFEENGNAEESFLNTSIHNDESETVFFDEEALYNMPGLLDSMAEGLLITPPSRALVWDHSDSEIDLTLWNN
ncbi:Dehydration-responsive element-binding protein [Vigna angularis]|uniref:Dehydration-responsive element-binding protein n=2 Tax=Phaseolus angularis TaxID=3914 RepID=A0A8T0KCZ1_PHAAN|nr:dehydration-responsive element-binding protein 1B [Vigna angularis]KAG2397474.1 Dehydration-responsive element-binding protein [Vigna angularis]